MNICIILGEYNTLNAGCIKEIKQAKRICKPDLTCILLNKNIKNNGDFLYSNQVNLTNEAVDNGADLVLTMPSLFTLCKKEIYSLVILKILNLFGANNTFNLICPVYSEDMEDIEMAQDMIHSENNDGFLVGNSVFNVHKTETTEKADISNMLTGISNEILAETYYKAKQANLDVNLIPILKCDLEEDTEQIIDYNKYNLLTKTIISQTKPEEVKKHLEYIEDKDNPESTAKKIGIPLLLHLDIDKKGIIEKIINLDCIELLAFKNNKKKYLNKNVFIDNISTSRNLLDLDAIDKKILELINLIKR